MFLLSLQRAVSLSSLILATVYGDAAPDLEVSDADLAKLQAIRGLDLDWLQAASAASRQQKERVRPEGIGMRRRLTACTSSRRTEERSAGRIIIAMGAARTPTVLVCTFALVACARPP